MSTLLDERLISSVGSDFDGIGGPDDAGGRVIGLENVSKYRVFAPFDVNIADALEQPIS